MLKFVGSGFFDGVPMRDLSDDEVKKFDKELLLKSGLYIEEKEVTKWVSKHSEKSS